MFKPNFRYTDKILNNLVIEGSGLHMQMKKYEIVIMSEEKNLVVVLIE